MYLRQFKKLRLINLAENPIAASPDYRSYVLSHIKDLTYLDYRRVNAADVATAIEQHQVSKTSVDLFLAMLRALYPSSCMQCGHCARHSHPAPLARMT